MARIPPHKQIRDVDIIPGDDGEEMEWEENGIYGCGGRYYRSGWCRCPDCTDRGDWECHARQDEEMMREYEKEKEGK